VVAATLFAATGQQPTCYNFLSQYKLGFFSSSLSLWIYLWLAETGQQPISQTTWLKVTPHCNHCKHYIKHGQYQREKNASPRCSNF
jgi:hypothetical protein